MHTTSTITTKAFHLVACVKLFRSEINILYSDSLLLLARLDYMICLNSKATAIINNNYSCLITAVKLD